MNTRNRAIEFYRFLFSLAICVFHFRTYTTEPRPFDSGYLAVEFFFILSGIFLAQSAERRSGAALDEKANSSISFFLQRYKRLYPHYLFSVICIAVVRIFIIHNLTVKKWLQEGLSELFMLQSAGSGNLLSVVLWFSSALLLASFAVYFLRLWNASICNVLFPLFSFGINSHFLQTKGTIGVTFSYMFLFSDGFWRALAGLMLGCVCYELVKFLKKRDLSRYKALFSFVEAILAVTLVFLLYTPAYREKNYIVLILFAVFLVITLGQTSHLSNLLNNGLSQFLGKISYAVYLNQIVVYMIFFNLFPSDDKTSMLSSTLIYLAIVVFISVLTTWMIEGIGSIVRRIVKSNKRNSPCNK